MLDNNQNDENRNLDENNNQENNQNDNQERKRSMMGRMSGNIKSKAKGKIKAKMAAWFTKTFIIFVMKVLPIFLAVCFAYTAFSWIADLVESAKNPSDVYDEMGISDLSDLMCIAGNADDGYYLAYKQGIDDKLDEIVKDYTKQQLTDMYITFYSEKPLTSFDKRKIALTIYHSIYSMGRTKTLLG